MRGAPDAGVPLRGALHAAAVLPAALVAALVQHRLAAPCACIARFGCRVITLPCPLWQLAHAYGIMGGAVSGMILRLRIFARMGCVQAARLAFMLAWDQC